MNVYLSIFKNNSTRVELRGLSAYVGTDDTVIINGATVTARLLDDTGQEIPGQSWPLPLLYETGSDGDYSGVVAPTLDVAEGDLISAEITAISAGDQGFWDLPVQVERRTHRTGWG